MKIHNAPEGMIYVFKKNIEFYGKAVIITLDDDYTIDDFVLLDELQHNAMLEEIGHERNIEKEND
jgi:hypothetical protein